MPDHARSTDPAVQRQLDRLSYLSPGADVLGLSRITELLKRVGNPQDRLPPVFHVAGTNGKGSTCAYLRAALEAAGHRVHVYSSPHLVRFNERIRVAGTLIDDAVLAPLLEEVLDIGGDIGASFFEVTTAVAFLAFARTTADACVIEVGLGGRLDATNILREPAACGIAQLGIDHQAFLGDTILDIAGEKAGIAKPGRPIAIFRYEEDVRAKVRAVAEAGGARVLEAGIDWSFEVRGDRLHYRDAQGELVTHLPFLPGEHQHANLALALAMLRSQDRVPVPERAQLQAPLNARWPARMQRLSPGPLTALLPEGSEIWLDGGHNPAAADAVSAALAERARGRKVRLVLGMLANKDARGLLAPFVPLAESLTAVPTPGHEHHSPEMLAGIARELGIAVVDTAADVKDALGKIAEQADGPQLVQILGSLYLAGTVLAANDEIPD